MDSSILFSSHAKLPRGSASFEVYRELVLVISVNIHTGIITEAECTLVTQMSKNFVARILIGNNMNYGPEEIVKCVRETYQGSAQQAIIAAIHNIYDEYLSYTGRIGL